MDGIINVYKEAGFTSHDVVAKLRGILHQKKIGHTGTLDPQATGVLPVCLGSATKVCELLTDKDKSYRAVVRLGIQTDTLDMTGTILNEEENINVTDEEIKKVVSSYFGESMQVPPMYSALKVNGRKLCDLARKGVEIERVPRKIYISDINAYDINIEEKTFTLDVTCSKGTYVRSLCEDIGKKLGTYACMQSLVRTRSGIFEIKDAVTLAQIEENGVSDILVQVDSLFTDYPEFVAYGNDEARLMNGNIIYIEDTAVVNNLDETDYMDDKSFKEKAKLQKLESGTKIRVYNPSKEFKAIYIIEENYIKPVKMFL